MKAVILAGGKGSRLSEETHLRPKPMVEIGGRPILWHIMKIFSKYGINDFIICAGYKGHMIKKYFADYTFISSNVTFDLSNNTAQILNRSNDPWRVTVVDTGDDTMTGGRILRIKDFIEDETFLLTYGDGLADVDIKNLLAHHEKNQCLATLTAVRPPGRFGVVKFPCNGESRIQSFEEKTDSNETWINGGYFALNRGVFDYIKDGDSTIWEQEPLFNLAKENQLVGHKHFGFKSAMDTLRDKIYLEQLYAGKAPAPWL